MNASAVFVLFIVALLAVVSGFPAVDDFGTQEYDVQLSEEPQRLEPHIEVVEHDETGYVRHRRATCDLLSISVPIGSLNHSACAAHCLALRKGFRGGRCKDGVCHCRK